MWPCSGASASQRGGGLHPGHAQAAATLSSRRRYALVPAPCAHIPQHALCCCPCIRPRSWPLLSSATAAPARPSPTLTLPAPARWPEPPVRRCRACRRPCSPAGPWQARRAEWLLSLFHAACGSLPRRIQQGSDSKSAVRPPDSAARPRHSDRVLLGPAVQVTRRQRRQGDSVGGRGGQAGGMR